jgi:predicted nucleic acid-binding protein
VAAYLFDSSALVKGYVNELGSAWVRGILDPSAGHLIHVARITGVEVVSAIARRQRGGSISATAASNLLAAFRQAFGSTYLIIDISAPLLARALDLAEVHELRGYDAVQLAAALDVKARCTAQGISFTLISANAELNGAATAEGLAVDDPNRHP